MDIDLRGTISHNGVGIRPVRHSRSNICVGWRYRTDGLRNRRRKNIGTPGMENNATSTIRPQHARFVERDWGVVRSTLR